MFIEKTSFRVRYCETDQMGVVNNGVYPSWFEVGRTELFRKFTLPYSEFEKKGIFLPLSELKIKYHFPAYYDELIMVTALLKEIPVIRVAIHYEIHNEKGKLIASGETTQAFLDAKTMRPTRIPAFLKEDMERYLSTTQFVY
jgi:acyl-CoA thioester hydrolase